MTYLLGLDCGTSRLHWALVGPRGLVAHAAIPNQEIGTLALRDWQNLPRPSRVIGVNVAGEAIRVRVESQMVRWRTMPEWLTASAFAAGVHNGYAAPSQLGADRWAALVAARARLVTELFPLQCVVVSARTVVTIDAMDADGSFRGGIVVPGINSMLQSIAASAPGLRMPPGRYHPMPLSNADGLQTGAVEAICGAIEQMRRRLASSRQAMPKCFIGGGAAGEIAPLLTAPTEVVDNLVLEGVFALAESQPEARR